MVKKAVGAKAKHIKTVNATSGKRTGKSQRKAERRERILEKEKARTESGMDVDGEKKNTGKSLGLALKKVGAGKKVYSKLLPSSSSKRSKSRDNGNGDLMIE